MKDGLMTLQSGVAVHARVVRLTTDREECRRIADLSGPQSSNDEM